MKKLLSFHIIFLCLVVSLSAQDFTAVFEQLDPDYPQIQLTALNGQLNEVATGDDGDFVIYMNGVVTDEKFRINDGNGFVGINNAVPSQQLDVTGSANVSSYIFSNHLRVGGNADGNAWATGVDGDGIYRDGKIFITTKASPTGPDDQGITFENTSNDRWTILNNDDPILGDLDIFFNNTLRGYFSDTNGAYTSVSDRDLKKNIESLPGVLSRVNKLVATKYHYLDNVETDPMTLGFMAQDAHPLFPELVSVHKGHMGINYAGFSVVAIKAIQEQQLIIDDQQTQLDDQEEKLDLQQDILDKMSIELEEIKALLKG